MITQEKIVWIKSDEESKDYYYSGWYVSDKNGRIAECIANESDALLIAAAPDMLEALKEVVKWIALRHDIRTTPFKDIEDQKPFIQQAMRAIAKAMVQS